MTSLGNIFLGQYQVHSETLGQKNAMLFRLSSKAFSRAVNGKKKSWFPLFSGHGDRACKWLAYYRAIKYRRRKKSFWLGFEPTTGSIVAQGSNHWAKSTTRYPCAFSTYLFGYLSTMWYMRWFYCIFSNTEWSPKRLYLDHSWVPA